MSHFDPSAANERLNKFWNLGTQFGLERDPEDVYLHEWVSDRLVLVNGLQILRDELLFAGIDSNPELRACGADFSLPSVCPTLAHTNCGDRIHQGAATSAYERIVASRFATVSELGELKLEAFAPTGGGTDDGQTLAHVTVAHQLDGTLRRSIYEGNAQSYLLVAFDLKTHCGRHDLEAGQVTFGETRESRWREARAACGAIVGTLKRFNDRNPVHVRLRNDLGELNYRLLTEKPFLSQEGLDVTPMIAAAIVAIRGMQKTTEALTSELDERGLGHVTASITVNRPGEDDTIIYLARSTVFHGKIRYQGLGLDAARYTASMVDHHGEKRLLLSYDGQAMDGMPIQEQSYSCQAEKIESYYFD